MNDFPMAEILCCIQEALARAVDALKPFESGSVEARLKFGKELVTEADHAVNNVLRNVLPRDGEGCAFPTTQRRSATTSRGCPLPTYRDGPSYSRPRRLLRSKAQGHGVENERGITRTVVGGALRDVLLPLAPVIRLFDTSLPRPWPVYRAFYFHYILPEVTKRLGARAD